MADHDDPSDQDAVIEFLSRPESYGLSPDRAERPRECPMERGVEHGVERIETHCSIVFLADALAYKLKRAIRYADLDYTTLAARRTACAAELVLNRRTAPDLYLGIRAIARAPDGHLAFDGPGQVLDHVVVMRRFAQENLFDHLAARAALTPGLMISLGEALAEFHRNAGITLAHGGAVSLRRVIAGNARERARHVPALERAMIDEVGALSCTALDRLAPLIERRRARGKVRRCHGDLRLANIVLDAGRPVLFDGIEFSDEIACIDVLYDLAFLLMDLLLHDRSDLASLVFNAYLDRLPETEGLAALPLFLSLRAATRCYGLAGSAERNAGTQEAVRKRADARRHLASAVAFLAPVPPRLIALGGEIPDGTRAFLAASLTGAVAPPPGARLLHLGPAPEPAWRAAKAILTAGCSVLLEGAFSAAAERVRAAGLARHCRVRFVGIWPGLRPPGLESPPWHTLPPGPNMPAAAAALAAEASPAETKRSADPSVTDPSVAGHFNTGHFNAESE